MINKILIYVNMMRSEYKLIKIEDCYRVFLKRIYTHMFVQIKVIKTYDLGVLKWRLVVLCSP